MDKVERFAYVALGFIGILYVFALIIGMLKVLPYGLIGIVLFIGIGMLVIKASKNQVQVNEEDCC